MRKSNNGLVWWNSVMAFLTWVASSTVMADVVTKTQAAVFLMIVGGLQAATAAYVAGTKPIETGSAIPQKYELPTVSGTYLTQRGMATEHSGGSTVDIVGNYYAARDPGKHHSGPSDVDGKDNDNGRRDAT